MVTCTCRSCPLCDNRNYDLVYVLEAGANTAPLEACSDEQCEKVVEKDRPTFDHFLICDAKGSCAIRQNSRKVCIYRMRVYTHICSAFLIDHIEQRSAVRRFLRVTARIREDIPEIRPIQKVQVV